MCIFVHPNFPRHSSAFFVKYLSLQHIQTWLVLNWFFSLHLLCSDITDCLDISCSPPMRDWTSLVSSLFISKSSLLLVKYHWRKDQEQRKTSCFLLQHNRSYFHNPFNSKKFPEDSSCWANFLLFSSVGVGHTQAYLCTRYL